MKENLSSENFSLAIKSLNDLLSFNNKNGCDHKNWPFLF
jgi:hypothetical protein